MNFLDNLLIIHFYLIGHFVVTQMHCKCHVVYSMIYLYVTAKNQAIDNDDNNCVLLLDEMQLSMLVEYDPVVKKNYWLRQ